jgi:RNA polymerase sigma factor (sigma-70 family)
MPPELDSTLLYRAHRSALVDYARSIVRDHARAEDVVQDAWERMRVAEQVRVLGEPLSYFYRIVRNLALDGQRAQRREQERGGGDVQELAEALVDPAPTPEAGLAVDEELRIVQQCLDELPERSRLALTLHMVEGLKLREIAERLQVSITTTHQLIADAKLRCIQRLPART